MSHTDMIFRAVEFAARARTAQLSQSADVPDIVHPFGVAIIHPFGVAKILIDHTCPDELVAADILHDALDDTGTTVEDIRRVFGGSNRSTGRRSVGAGQESQKAYARIPYNCADGYTGGFLCR